MRDKLNRPKFEGIYCLGVPLVKLSARSLLVEAED